MVSCPTIAPGGRWWDVGGDGVHSRVRTVLNPGGAPARYLPMLNISGHSRSADAVVPSAKVAVTPAVVCASTSRKL